MRKLFILTLFLSVQSIWAMDDVTDELDAAWDKLKTTVSKGDFRSFKSVYHRDAILVNGITNKSYPIKDAFTGWKQGFEDTRSGRISFHKGSMIKHQHTKQVFSIIIPLIKRASKTIAIFILNLFGSKRITNGS